MGKPGQRSGRQGGGGRVDAGAGAGVDEAGRGPLAGPVVAAAVVLDPGRPVRGLDDSKRLTPRQRERLDGQIRSRALGVGVGVATEVEIDTLNIRQATFLAMRRALDALGEAPFVRVLVDGNAAFGYRVPVRAIVGGDATVEQIQAASIVAKVFRDRKMVFLDLEHPGYQLARHKGYGTQVHRVALERLGPSPIHRRSFAPVRRSVFPTRDALVAEIRRCDTEAQLAIAGRIVKARSSRLDERVLEDLRELFRSRREAIRQGPV